MSSTFQIANANASEEASYSRQLDGFRDAQKKCSMKLF